MCFDMCTSNIGVSHHSGSWAASFFGSQMLPIFGAGQVAPLPRRRSVTFQEQVLVITDTSREFTTLAKQGAVKRRFKALVACAGGHYDRFKCEALKRMNE